MRHPAGRAAPLAGQGHDALTVIRSLKFDGRNKKPALPAAFHRMLRNMNVSKESRMMICGQGVAERWARADRLCGGGLHHAVRRAKVRVRGRAGSVSRLCGGRRGKHGCMACARSVCGTTAGHVRAAAGPGAVGVERRRTRKYNWSSMMRSMYCGGDVDHGGEDVCTAAHKPSQK